MIAITFILLFIFCFLYVLNLHLQGAKKDFVLFVLMILIIGSVIYSFFIDKWWIGLIAIFAVFLFFGLARPLAQYVAFKILGYRTGVDDFSTGESVNQFFKTLESEGNFEKAMKNLNSSSENIRIKLKKIYQKKNIQLILNSYGVSFEEYNRLFEELNINLHDLALEILSSTNDLKKLLEMKKNNTSISEIQNYFRSNYR